ncbi:hypothetical protein TTHERM_00393300 (macronuclear) [Tetrahymena thermophila SB210]|uniref:Uncharacterized protein n=1 Tax=Tetrahymena thermophila (strain SB210) TaxID=312017 RepID=Q233C4_TETTS|nr:hypothetical protein TTHERM_00393300 [Tetrahymena thermophila SB210]EAR91656.2 hypothetical protein TTHERM_00393300 [Tetrahymena thermophila SB210]|eukprot:XP_001011901.2 hypothetical protein TTHERM_00393300 [Tetrahymena thermophila SB210]
MRQKSGLFDLQDKLFNFLQLFKSLILTSQIINKVKKQIQNKKLSIFLIEKQTNKLINQLKIFTFHYLKKIFGKNIRNKMTENIELFYKVEEFVSLPLQLYTDVGIKLKGYDLEAQDLLELGKALASCSNLQTLLLQVNFTQIGDQGIQFLDYGLSSCTNLSNLTMILNNNLVGNQGAYSISSGLKKCLNIQNLMLNIGSNQIGDQGIQYIGSAIEALPNLSQLELQSDLNLIRKKGVVDLGTCLSNSINLNSLKLSLIDNKILLSDPSSLGFSFLKCPYLQTLELKFQVESENYVIGNQIDLLDQDDAFINCPNLLNLEFKFMQNEYFVLLELYNLQFFNQLIFISHQAYFKTIFLFFQ